VYIGWITPQFRMYDSAFDMKKIRNVVVCTLDMENTIKSRSASITWRIWKIIGRPTQLQRVPNNFTPSACCNFDISEPKLCPDWKLFILCVYSYCSLLIFKQINDRSIDWFGILMTDTRRVKRCILIIITRKCAAPHLTSASECILST